MPGLHRVNLGCGSRFHPSWINIDMRATGDGVIAHDLSKGIPLPDQSCDVVYHSHVLEHIPRERAPQFLGECYRVLAPGGIIRVAVPDLERICRTYLEKLELALRGDAAAVDDYKWIVLELYDQAVRNKSGGGMRDYIAAPELKNSAFILERIGEEGEGLIRALRAQQSVSVPTDKRSFFTRLRNVPNRIRTIYGRTVTRFLLGGKNAEALDAGLMRLSGEVHQWMYDRFSLAEALRSAGFESPTQLSATESQIPGWVSYNLDTLETGKVVKPDSLFMEAKRPAA